MATEEKLKRMVNNHHGSRVSNGKLCMSQIPHIPFILNGSSVLI